jgi:hypothetical protein
VPPLHNTAAKLRCDAQNAAKPLGGIDARPMSPSMLPSRSLNSTSQRAMPRFCSPANGRSYRVAVAFGAFGGSQWRQ